MSDLISRIPTGYTPGPWVDAHDGMDDYSVDARDSELCWSAVGPEGGDAVALVVVPEAFVLDDLQAANAALIALAPDLAAALIAAEARIAELEAALTWRPIETAPNEESILILYDDGSVRLIEAEENDLEWRPWQGARGPGVSLPMLWMDATGITSAAVAAIAALNPGDPK